MIKALTETYNKDPEAWGYRSLNSMIEYFVKDHFKKSEEEREKINSSVLFKLQRKKCSDKVY